MTFVAAGLLAVCLAGLLTPAPAVAHAIIVGSEPAHNETLASPQRLVLRFNSKLEKHLCSVTLVGPQRQSILLLRQDADVPANTLAYRLPQLGPGEYQVHWKVLAVDGHVTEGRLLFHVHTG